MPLKEQRYLEQPDIEIQKQHIGTKSKLKTIIKELINEIEELKTQKNDTSNLKNSFKQHVEDENASLGILKTRIDAIELLVKNLVSRLEEIENIEF